MNNVATLEFKSSDNIHLAMNFFECIQEIRADLGLSANEFMKETGITHQQMYHYKYNGGNPYPARLRELERILGVEFEKNGHAVTGWKKRTMNSKTPRSLMDVFTDPLSHSVDEARGEWEAFVATDRFKELPETQRRELEVKAEIYFSELEEIKDRASQQMRSILRKLQREIKLSELEGTHEKHLNPDTD